jgi:AcrR family transcriptional regulator
MIQNATSETAGTENRRLDIIRAAARLFAAQGYAGTSMRDIAAAVGMLPGSLYYHFPSKEMLIEQIFIVGSQTLSTAVEAAVAGLSDPWARLEQACITHLEAHLSDSRFAAAITAESLRLAPSLRARLVAHLDRYEALFTAMVQALDLPPEIDRSIYRLSLLSTLNAVEFWYRPGGRAPDYIARQIFAIYDHRGSRRR